MAQPVPNHSEYQPDFIATEMLSEIKRSSKRWFGIAMALLVAWLVTIGAFLWYLNQYDFSGATTTSYETVKDANGLYAVIDSDGNVIASDIPDKELGEYLNGISTSNNDNNENNENNN